MEIVWTAEAERHLSALAGSFLAKDGAQAAADVVARVAGAVARLAASPYEGRRLAGRRGAYRSLPVGLYVEVVYRVVGHKVMVIVIWDCRHAPLDLAGLLAG